MSNNKVKSLIRVRPAPIPFIPAPAGTHFGKVEDINIVEEADSFAKGNPLAEFVHIHLTANTPEGDFKLRKKCKLTWSEKGTLYSLLNAFNCWPGHDEPFEFGSLIGRDVIITVSQKTTAEGKTYANVGQVVPAPSKPAKQEQVPALSDEEAEEAEIEKMAKAMIVQTNKPIEKEPQNDSSSDAWPTYDEYDEDVNY